MKYIKILLPLFFICLSFASKAQPYGNEWIDYDKSYYKLWVHEDGIYQVSYSQLEDAGFPVTSINPKAIQLWFRGEERAIRIEGEADGSFDSGDYIEFYGQQNDGTLDAFMYEDKLDHTNPYYNMYSDQTAYFLTFSSDGTEGKRMEEFFESNTSLTPLAYHIEENLRHYTDNFAQGALFPESITFNRGASASKYSEFSSAKGYSSGRWFTGASNMTATFNGIPVKNKVDIATPETLLQFRLNARYKGRRTGDILVGNDLSNLRNVGLVDFRDYSNHDFSTTLNSSDLPTTTGDFVFQVAMLDTEPFIGSEAVSISFYKLRYPQKTDAESATKIFNLPANSPTKSRLLIENPPTNARLFDLTNRNQIILIGTESISGNMNAIVPNANNSNKLFLTAEIKSIDSLKSIQFGNESIMGKNYLLVYSSLMAQPSENYANPIQAYIDYRNSTEGGGYTVLAKSIEELYNEFGYGEITPLVLRRFSEYMLEQGSVKPEFLFLVGKALELTFQYERKKPASLGWSAQNLLPCYGAPCADNTITQGLDGKHPYVPAISTGRIASRSPQQVENYLEKVKQHGQYSFNNFERKNLLFLSGGQTEVERNRMVGHSDYLASLTKTKHLGAKTQRVSKVTSFSVEYLDIVSNVNAGIGMINYFGHTSNGTLDIDIGNVSNSALGYNNEGKYPVIWVNGCDAGDIFTTQYTQSEDWTLTKNKGSILFAAHVDWGYEYTLRVYNDELFRQVYMDSLLIGKPFGTGLRISQEKMMAKLGNNQLARTHVQQFALQGDPAVNLFGSSKAEYAISDESLDVLPSGSLLTASSDSFLIAVNIKNYGAVNGDRFSIGVKRTFGNGEEKLYELQYFDPVYYQDTVYFTVRNTDDDKEKSTGLNRFEVTVDYTNEIPEVHENTNTGFIDYLLSNSAAIALSPTEFSIANKQPVTLIAQNINKLSEDRMYTFQIDTTDKFNSAVLQEKQVFSNSLPTWIPNLISDNTTDSIVYYWRVKFTEPTAIDISEWSESSFLYVKDGSEGWSQSHFPQFKKNTTTNVRDNQQNRKWEFDNESFDINVNTTGVEHINRGMSIFLNGEDLIGTADEVCMDSSLVMLSIEGNTGKVRNPIFQYPAFVCGVNKNLMMTSDFYLENSASLFRDIIRGMSGNGDYLIFVSNSINSFDKINPASLPYLEQLGFDRTTFANIAPGEPFVAIGRNQVGFEAKVFQADRNSSIPLVEQALSIDLGLSISGIAQIKSTLIGPASGWGTVVNEFASISENDSIKLNLIGVNAIGEESILRENLQLSRENNISDINHLSYPYLRLQASVGNPNADSLPQLDMWQVLYQPLPEGALSLNSKQEEEGEIKLQEGENLTFDFNFRNVSSEDFTEKLIVEYQIRKNDNSTTTSYDTLQILSASDSIAFTKTFSTIGLAGMGSIRAYVNPELQPEQDYSNNIITLGFEVAKDSTHPLLDVLFDGTHIMNGEIVSANPIISITGKDENEFMSLSDTSNVEVFLSEANSEVSNRVDLGSSQITWVAQSTNSFQLDFKPEGLQDGVYTLEIQLQDATGNKSGVQPYKIQFEVITKSSITHFYPYPNPFSSSVRFVFTLTGGNIPDEMKIQIMTVTGRVVREILQDEIGAIRVGDNITEYAWDGKDEYGDQLANGVYLYRVITKYNGQELERRETSGDNLFKKGYGKMYLMR
ncbi:MAG: hypothetical protein ACJAWV_001855 [Flammeovirgaceae bacterium]|jgi:hypothetical protein